MSARPRTGLGRDAAAAVAGLGLEKLVALGIALYLPRHLGLAGFGRYALVLSVVGFFQVLPDAGLEAVLVTRLARSDADPVGLAGRAARVRVVVSFLGAALGLAVLAAVTADAGLVGAAAVAAAGTAATAANPYRALLRARLRLGRWIALVGAQSAIAIGLLAAVVRAGGGLVAVLGAVTAASIAGIGLGRALVGGGARLGGDTGLRRALVAEAWPLVANALALMGAQQVLLQVLLVRLHGVEAVGLLAAAQKLVDAVGQLPQALMLSVLPALAAASSTPAGAVPPARAAARVLVVVVVPAAALLALYAEPILGLVFGPAWSAAAPVLRVLAPSAVLVATGAVLSNLLVALGLQRALMRVTLGGATLLVVLGALLVPAHGAVGAALASLLALLAGQTALVLLPTTRGAAAPVLAGVARPVAIGAALALLAAALGASLRVGGVVLLVGYPLALALTGTVTRMDLERWRR